MKQITPTIQTKQPINNTLLFFSSLILAGLVYFLLYKIFKSSVISFITALCSFYAIFFGFVGEKALNDIKKLGVLQIIGILFSWTFILVLSSLPILTFIDLIFKSKISEHFGEIFIVSVFVAIPFYISIKNKLSSNYILDTSFLMEIIGIKKKNKLLYRTKLYNDVFFIHTSILKELEGLKKNKNENTAQKARNALKYLRQLQQYYPTNFKLINKLPDKKEIAKYGHLDSFADKTLIWLCKKLEELNINPILLTIDNTLIMTARKEKIDVRTDFDVKNKGYNPSRNSSFDKDDVVSDPACSFLSINAFHDD